MQCEPRPQYIYEARRHRSQRPSKRVHASQLGPGLWRPSMARLSWLVLLAATASCRWSSSRKHSTGNGCGFQSCPALSNDHLNVHIICHSHLDADVQHIYTSVRDSLMKYPQRRFVSAENVFFSRWLRMQTNHQAMESVHELVRAGRLQFVGGGWTQNDEAVTHYTAIVDQMTMGLRFLNYTFGECGNVKVAWQIDPFGHSKAFAALVSEMGYDCLVVSRVHHALSNHWRDTKRLEFVWKPQAEIGSSHDMFTMIMYRGTYTVPSEFCVQDYYCSVYDSQSAAYATNNIAIYIGGDLAFQNADRWFNQVDASIKAVNYVKGHRVRATYSTPLCYLGALHASNRSWPVYRGDLLPYVDTPGRTWVGFYSSRPNLKEYARYANGFLQVWRRTLALFFLTSETCVTFRLASSSLGTSKAAVAQDYAKLLSAGIAQCEAVMSRAVNQLMDASGAAGDLPWRFCHALNVSECVHSAKLDLTETDGEFTLLLYNPSSTALSTYARLPAVPLIMTLLNIPERNSATKTELTFPVELPPLGYSAYLVTAQKKKEEMHFASASLEFLLLEPEQRFIENERYRLELDTTSGLVRRVTLLGQESGVSLRQSFYAYSMEAKRQTSATAGGAYSFDPDTNRPVDLGNKVTYRVVQPRSRTGGVNSHREHSGGVMALSTLKVNSDVIKAVKGASRRYAERLAAEERPSKRMRIDAEQSSPNVELTNDQAKKEVAEAERMIKNADLLIQRGMKLKNFSDIESGRAGPFVTEVHQIFDQWLSQVIRLYKNSQFIEFEWIVGPLPSGASTDVTTRYETSLDNDGVFFTDSNGMFTVARRVNDSLDPASVASSYYPVVSWIYIKNHAEELQMTVIPDRPQGGTSFVQGTIELMLHRRYFIDDDLGVDEPLNDRGVNDEGIVVKGRHRLHLGTPKHSELRVALPPGGHLMTLEGTEDNRTLVRIENIHQDLTINVSITHLLHSFLLLDARETVLSAHQYRSEVQRRPWPQTEGKYVAPDESAYLMLQVHGNMLVNIQPGQIRTFLAALKAFSLPPASRARQ
ncbi:hypothetical protein HPB52_005634 [Rhipicephalus sanguineus]|uniref:Alpha-mannosidase n=1 Tax=Rhipicephalus sanguineus TaxID=34632 RepID=A0A9D4QDU8_RHISA|nr:hypothetical protein HPB52_005634 [Rhipicephalus sanguineus]